VVVGVFFASGFLCCGFCWAFFWVFVWCVLVVVARRKRRGHGLCVLL